MAKGKLKKKKAKKDIFTVYFNSDGIFTSCPLLYAQGQMKEVNDTNFDEMSYEHLLEIVKRLVSYGSFEKVGYDNRNQIDMFVEHFSYDIMELPELERNEEQNNNSIESSDDDYYSSDECEEIENIKKGVLYPAFDHDIPWDKMEPTLGMRNVEEGRCAGKKGNKDMVMPNKVRTGVQKSVKKKALKKKAVKKQVVKKKVVSECEEGSSQSPKWTKKKILDSKKVACPFRMYASWMSNEHSFKIKSLISEHKCCRNYNLGSLAIYKWIALQFFKEIDKCMRAKQLALFDHEGRLIEHYGKLYEYRQALLDSNPGSTCRFDVDESVNRCFKRMYIYFKGVKDAMGRDANNQMYPIAWVVVRVENAENWGWFLHLLHDDLCLKDRTGITIISDSHKGLIDVVNDWLPEA
ncbi:calcium/proton exchanger [Tanacetum coccineum]